MDSLHYVEKFCMPVLAGPSYVIKVSFFLYVLQMNSEKPSTQRSFSLYPFCSSNYENATKTQLTKNVCGLCRKVVFIQHCQRLLSCSQ